MSLMECESNEIELNYVYEIERNEYYIKNWIEDENRLSTYMLLVQKDLQ